VRFVAETPERARVTLEHRHLDRHGEGWENVTSLDAQELSAASIGAAVPAVVVGTAARSDSEPVG
jgi:hypothetical protein